MSSAYIGQIWIFAGNFAPRGSATCDGQLLSIQQNQALFALLGTTYGGNGVQTFALPDLRSRVAMHFGNGAGLTPRVLGEVGGTETITINQSEMPQHTHPVAVQSNNANLKNPSGNIFAAVQGTATNVYSNAAPNATMDFGLTPSGGSQPHSNIQPYLALYFVIQLVGIFPSRN